MTTIAIVAAGAMGAAVGSRFVQGGCTVLTNLDGRSPETRIRAINAGMQDVSLAEISRRADWVLSILPPRDAYAFAAKFLSERQNVDTGTSNRDLAYADCNAVNPVSVKRIAALFSSSVPPIPFVDAGIIGGPPSDVSNPVFYASADDEKALEGFARLSKYGLRVSLLKGEGVGIGDASALKMSYAGITKGTIGLLGTMILAAHKSSPATADALLHELGASQGDILKRVTRTVPGMIPKAYRWIGEMEEIAGFVGEGEEDIYKGLAKLFTRIEGSLKDDKREDIEVLNTFVEEARKLT